MQNHNQAAWLGNAHRYYSQIGHQSADPVTVFSAGDEEVGSEKPGTPLLYLEPRPRLVRVLDADKLEQGTIRSEGIVPGAKHVMRRNNSVVWVLSVRSLVRKRHTLEPFNGERWTFDTPFFWWQQLSGTVGGVPTLLGQVGPVKRLWFMWVKPGSDTLEVLAAVALMHRQWWRS